ncbi:hypothetical protein A4G99_17980 [Haladaptatus sp. R4]|uniref:polysaccharide deacetylase family protein n=1 Tax=Haladaptatus sp. R4 TaxID=1679489 RepID=UPI0007B4E243|nr:polysaccharide deacetylase family protein [Haladaptatus sp. R4]KZN22963.1 hypothetical protein A4G99_17980 [Haladaptatus sp. R4]
MAVSRREFITSATATAIAGRVVTGTVSAKPTTKGRIVLVYDDGPVTDYTKAFPVHKEEGVPASIGVVSKWVGTDGSESMSRAATADELSEMESFGFEIMSHTRDHTSLTSFPLAADIEPDDTRAYPKGPHASHPFHPGYEVEIYDGNKSVTRKIVGSGRNDDDDRYMVLDEPVGTTFDADTARERLTPKTMRYLLHDSKRTLESYGFEVDNLLAPFDQFSGYAERFTEEFYTGVANAVDSDGINSRGQIDPYGIRRDYFIEYTDWETISGELDTIAETNALGVFGAHTQREEVTPEKIRRMIRAAKRRGIEIVTLRQALADAGFGPETATTTTTTTTTTNETTTTETATGNGTATSTGTGTVVADSTESSGGENLLDRYGPVGAVGCVGAGLGALWWRQNDAE